MPEWFYNSQTTELPPDLPILATRLLMAWALGGVVAWLARRHNSSSKADTLTLTLVLMSILIAMATQIIGDNVARAFSLVGALSIVRFRTAVPATRDVAFVLAAVVVGMAVGAGQYWVAVLGVVVVGMATQLNASKPGNHRNDSDVDKNDEATWKLTLQTGLSETGGWESEIRRLTNQFQLVSAETTRRGSAMQMVYRIVPKSGVNTLDLISALNLVPSVEAVEAKAV